MCFSNKERQSMNTRVSASFACIHCLVANRDVKFQVDNFIRFMEDCLDLKIAMDTDQC